MSPDPLRYFRIEARELVDQISAGVLDLDQRPGPDPVARLLRFAHTLKGAARVVRQLDIADRAHALEEVLVPHRDGTAPLPGDEIRELLRLNDEIDARVTALTSGATPPDGAGAAARTEPGGPATATAGSTEPVGTGPVGTEPVGTGPVGTGKVDAGAAGGGDTGPGIAGPRGSGPGDTGSRGAGTGVGDAGPVGTGAGGPAPAEIGPAETGPAETGPAETGPSGIGPAGIGPAGIGPAGIGTGGVGPAGIGPGDFEMDGTTASGGAAGRPGSGDPVPTARAAGADLDDLLDAVGEAHARFASLRSATRALGRLHRTADTLAGRLRGGARPTDAPTSPESRSAAGRLADELTALNRHLTDAVEQVERELDEVRGRAERLRLVAAATIFTPLHRAVRDAADAEGKRVVFDGRGGDLRVDPQVLTQAANALLHVVRNAVAHGIEDAPQRVAAGKSAEGRVVVTVERRGRYAAFRCADDGRGFDLEALRRTARQRGLLPPGATAPDDTVLDLVLRGGISTTATVTEVAGRGIGLDVVRDAAVQLGGTVSVRTTPGAGATVELVVPLSLLSLHGLVVQAGDVIATVPLDAVRTCVRLLPAQAAAAEADGRLAHDGRAVPYLRLRQALGVPDTPEAGAPPDARVAVLVAADGDVVAVGVDRLTGTSTLVVRPLPELAPAVAVIGGVSIDLDGNPRLVLDAHGLVAEAPRHRGTGVATPARSITRLPILVVDDSLTTRMLERSILESAGYEVDLAASGEEGLEKARLRPYALFLTDIDMPGIDGFTFVERTRADPELAGVPAILVSSRSSAEDRRRGTEVGAGAYVVKGEFDQEELLAHIRRLVAA